MVGVVAANSDQVAAQILNAEDPLATLAVHHDQFMQGGLSTDTTLSGEVPEQLKINAALMRKAGGRGTPTLVYRDADDRVKMHPGMIEMNELLSLLGQG